MKLVIKYSDGDGYTYCCEENIPVEYESAEAFIVHFEEAARELLAKLEAQRTAPRKSQKQIEKELAAGTYVSPQQLDGDFIFAGVDFGDVHAFFREDCRTFIAPGVWTLEQWWQDGWDEARRVQLAYQQAQEARK